MQYVLNSNINMVWTSSRISLFTAQRMAGHREQLHLLCYTFCVIDISLYNYIYNAIIAAAYRVHLPDPQNPSELTGLYQQDDTLGETVGALSIVFLFQAGTESPGEGLPESGAYGAHEGLHNLIR